MNTRPFDIVLFGATSFVGKIVARYLLELNHPTLRWALASRSATKLAELKIQLGDRAAQLPTLIADTDDAQSVAVLCQQTRLVISTVGPYALYGESVVAACATYGTDYCDLTGEVQWMKAMLDRYQTMAEKSGARIVHCCGFDSIPSDLGVFFLQQQAKQTFGQYCSRIKMRVVAMRGGFSGGTIASMLNGVKQAITDPSIRKLMADPYALCPTSDGLNTPQHNVSREYDSDFVAWAAPFVMASINTRMVFRSNALAGYPYGRNFEYDEATLTGAGAAGKFRAIFLKLGLTLFGVALVIAPLRWLLQITLLPKPGQGPSEQAQREGFFKIQFVGRTADGLVMRAEVTGDRDPGYGSTAKMLSQAALCLAFDVQKTALAGGIWTPATAMGSELIKRLEKYAGLTFTSQH